MSNNNIKVSIIMGSDSDLPIMSKAKGILDEFDVNCEMRILSAHRVPKQLQEYINDAEKRNVKVFVAGAGLAAHLPGVVAAYTTRPVIGVPLASGVLKGVDSLLSIVQMPSGVPVATVAIDGAKNAAILALQILATNDVDLYEKIKVYKKKMEEEVLKKDSQLKN